MEANEDDLLRAVALARELTDSGERHSLDDIAAEFDIDLDAAEPPISRTLRDYLYDLIGALDNPGKAELGRTATEFLLADDKPAPRWEDIGRLVAYLGGDLDRARRMWEPMKSAFPEAVPPEAARQRHVRGTTTSGSPTLGSYLRELRLGAGQPALRALAKSTGISHAQIALILKGQVAAPAWPRVAALVDNLGGDRRHAWQLWEAQVGSSTAPTAGKDSLRVPGRTLDKIVEQLDEILVLLRRVVPEEPGTTPPQGR